MKNLFKLKTGCQAGKQLFPVLVVLLLLTLSGCTFGGTCGGGMRETTTMTQEEIAGCIFRLSDKEYFVQRTETGAMVKALLGMVPSVLAIGAPSEIDIDHRHSLPIIAATSFTGARAAQVRTRSTWVLIAVREEDGAVFAGPAFVPEPDERPTSDWYETGPPEPVRNEREASAIHSFFKRLDVRHALHLPWESATYRITLVAWDWTSNTVRVRLKGKKVFSPAPIEPDVPGDKSGFPIFTPVAGKSPEPPKQGPAIAFASKHIRTKGGLTMYAAFRFRLRQQYLVRNSTDPGLVALMPVTVMVASRNDRRARRHTWHVPIYSSEKMSDGDIATGYLAVPLFDAGDMPLDPDTYYVRTVVGGEMSRPEPVETGLNEMLIHTSLARGTGQGTVESKRFRCPCAGALSAE